MCHKTSYGAGVNGVGGAAVGRIWGNRYTDRVKGEVKVIEGVEKTKKGLKQVLFGRKGKK